MRKRIVYLKNNEDNLYSLYEALEAMVVALEKLATEHTEECKALVETPLQVARAALKSVRMNARIEDPDNS